VAHASPPIPTKLWLSSYDLEQALS
jgi:hypothetical protein